MKKNKLLSCLINWDLIVSGIMLCVLVICTFLGAFSRYLFSQPFNWLEEIQMMCQVWIVFCAGCAAFRLGGHVEIEFIAESLPLKLQKAVLAINTVVITIVLGYLFVNSISYLQVFIKSGRTTNVLNLSYVLIYGIVPVAVVLMLLNYYSTLKKQIKKIEQEYEKKMNNRQAMIEKKEEK